ncbi:hypothetical protein CEXT_412981 [Caerostris extrusa]|uniref:Uncharacterized protein n=1 Tax=Caerostris extrusa TaxID=172846 RepID=A0AAV4N8Q6_CAEEX|nr:hypothetical protein CEXT_412981 [Caerostris extrusa]
MSLGNLDISRNSRGSELSPSVHLSGVSDSSLEHVAISGMRVGGQACRNSSVHVLGQVLDACWQKAAFFGHKHRQQFFSPSSSSSSLKNHLQEFSAGTRVRFSDGKAFLFREEESTRNNQDRSLAFIGFEISFPFASRRRHADHFWMSGTFFFQSGLELDHTKCQMTCLPQTTFDQQTNLRKRGCRRYGEGGRFHQTSLLPLGILKGWKKNSTNSAHAFNPLWGAAVSSLFAIDPWIAYYLYALDDAQENLIPCLLGIRSIVKKSCPVDGG